MKKSYPNKQLRTDTEGSLNQYFFPKANPPITIEAETREEAEEKLQAIKNKSL